MSLSVELSTGVTIVFCTIIIFMALHILVVQRQQVKNIAANDIYEMEGIDLKYVFQSAIHASTVLYANCPKAIYS
jgi:hypothetical protein